MENSIFLSPLTFLDLPFSQDFSNSRIAIVGIPFDCGNYPTRFGSRQGPNAIRHGSQLTADLTTDAEPSPLDLDGIIDAGNVSLSLDNINDAFESIEFAMKTILDSDCIPVTLGGDGSVSLPQMRALSKKYGRISVLHFDAHTDTYPLKSKQLYDNRTHFTHAVKEELIDMAHAIHIGIRGPVNAVKPIKFAHSLGYEIIPYDKVRDWGIKRLVDHLQKRVSGQKIFLCFDMDYFDPSVAPGVATPTPGGAMPADGLEILRGLKGLDIVAVDINTTTPIHDTCGLTAMLAANVLVECLDLLV